MILGLGAPFDYDHISARVVRRLGDDLEKQRFLDVIRTRAREQKPSGLEDFECSEVDLLVTALSGLHAVTILGERWGIENDHLELTVRFVVFLQYVESIAFAKMNVGNGIELLVAPARFDGGGSHVDYL